MRVLVVIALMGILAALAAAGFFMLKSRKGGQRNMARALTVRISVSVALFLFILLSWKMGWIEPTGFAVQQR